MPPYSPAAYALKRQRRRALRLAQAAKNPIISICGWCPDAVERMKALKEQGYDVSHGICAECDEKLKG